MKRRFHLFIREHATGWSTATVLTHPSYAAHGPRASVIRGEIEDALRADLATRSFGETHFADLVHKPLMLEVKAVEHGRLVVVPMRFSVVWYPVDEEGSFEVRVPRLELVFRIYGEDNVLPWAEERIVGALHMKSVREVLAHEYELSERIEDIEVAPAKAPKAKGPSRRPGAALSTSSSPLAAVGLEWVAEAKGGHLPRAELRDAVVHELATVLASRRRPAALLIGPSGVGKTAVVQELAHRIALGQVEPRLAGAALWSIPGSRFVAGTRFLGEWQARAQSIVDDLRADRSILYAGSLLELATVGAGRERGMGLAQFLHGPIAAGELVIVAEATPDELALVEAQQPGFARAFQRIPLPSLAPGDTEALLVRRAKKLEKEHQLEWLPGAVAGALDVVARYGDGDGLPGSALALIERMARLGRAGGAQEARTKLGPADAVRAFARTSGFPEAMIDPARRLDVDEVRASFRRQVIGQDAAVERLVQVILLLKAGLNDPGRPLGSFLFMGPTGVGKTESALALTEYLFGDRKRLVRFDLGEYAAPGSAIRLVDGPDGQGALTRPVREQPFSVVLLDEVEKADGGVHDLLLQVLGEGRLTDGTGRTVRFDHTLLIMTSNLGAQRRAPVGYGGQADRPAAAHYLEAAEKYFRPELVNRIDHLVPFAELDQDGLRRIARLLLEQAIQREGLARRKVEVVVPEEVVDLVVARGFDPRYGARPMKRAVESEVMVPLARALVGGPLGASPTRVEGRRVALAVEGGAVVVGS